MVLGTSMSFVIVGRRTTCCWELPFCLILLGDVPFYGNFHFYVYMVGRCTDCGNFHFVLFCWQMYHMWELPFIDSDNM